MSTLGRWNYTFLSGHLALGYVLGRVASKWLNEDVNLPLLFTFSILPDIDMFIPNLTHHGPTHSIVMFILFFVPFFVLYGNRVAPYSVAFAAHIAGDFVVGEGLTLLWPLRTNQFQQTTELMKSTFKSYHVYTRFEMLSEWIIFLISLGLMVKFKDVAELMKPQLSNLLLLAVVAGTILSEFLLPFPVEMVVPHLAFLSIFISSSFLTAISLLRAKTE